MNWINRFRLRRGWPHGHTRLTAPFVAADSPMLRGIQAGSHSLLRFADRTGVPGGYQARAGVGIGVPGARFVRAGNRGPGAAFVRAGGGNWVPGGDLYALGWELGPAQAFVRAGVGIETLARDLCALGGNRSPRRDEKGWGGNRGPRRGHFLRQAVGSGGSRFFSVSVTTLGLPILAHSRVGIPRFPSPSFPVRYH